MLSNRPTAEVAEALSALRDAAAEVADWLPPLHSFKSLVGASLACNPGPHVTDIGICDETTGEPSNRGLIPGEASAGLDEECATEAGQEPQGRPPA
ncbi:hypothetical protein [Paracoccus sp. N5]|uniref:hypothetical protein n=1 Tax=Paracoccus sp. N5 TaxID=1101189 RepID=UPI0003608B18|nr:hypothetical protein [Paracoccus sp. N5]